MPHRILVVDDSTVIRMLVTAALRSRMASEVDLVEAGSGNDGLALLAVRKTALVIADYHMEGMDGLEFAQRIRAHANPITRSTPLLLLSSDRSPDLADRSARLGVNAFRHKPCGPAELVDTVRSLLVVRPSSVPPSGGLFG